MMDDQKLRLQRMRIWACLFLLLWWWWRQWWRWRLQRQRVLLVLVSGSHDANLFQLGWRRRLRLHPQHLGVRRAALRVVDLLASIARRLRRRSCIILVMEYIVMAYVVMAYSYG